MRKPLNSLLNKHDIEVYSVTPLLLTYVYVPSSTARRRHLPLAPTTPNVIYNSTRSPARTVMPATLNSIRDPSFNAPIQEARSLLLWQQSDWWLAAEALHFFSIGHTISWNSTSPSSHLPPSLPTLTSRSNLHNLLQTYPKPYRRSCYSQYPSDAHQGQDYLCLQAFSLSVSLYQDTDYWILCPIPRFFFVSDLNFA